VEGKATPQIDPIQCTKMDQTMNTSAVQFRRTVRSAAIISTATILALCGLAGTAGALDFQVAWIAIGEAAASAGDGSVRATRELVPIADLTQQLTRHGAKVTRVAIEPTVLEVVTGEQVCISALHIRAFGADGRQISGVPLSITVREDLREKLQLARSPRDICVRPSRGGEYPIRFTSKLPAPDGSTRGAQVFVRASDRSVALD
jgi:hypothetical protein